MEMRHFEDFDPGERFALGSTTVTAEEITAFAGAFDPQPVHTDPEAAGEDGVGGPVASGWHTAALCMRLLVESLLVDTTVGPGLGVDEVRFHTPVTPADELTVTAEVVSTEPWDDTWGKVSLRVVARNGDGEVVFERLDHMLFGRRAA